MISAIIVDDEDIARARIRRLLAGESDVRVLAECSDGPTAVEAVREQRPDLLLLDIQMPEMDGFQVLEAIGPDAVPVVVFVTAHDRYALEAFEAHALDYLLKPFNRERFRSTLQRARVQIG